MQASIDEGMVSGWGIPEAYFPLGSGGDSTCDYESHFDAHQLVFDLTFCVSYRMRFVSQESVTELVVVCRAIGQGRSIQIQAVAGIASPVSPATSLHPTTDDHLTFIFTVVDNNPDQFINAYWEVNSLRVYAPQN